MKIEGVVTAMISEYPFKDNAVQYSAVSPQLQSVQCLVIFQIQRSSPVLLTFPSQFDIGDDALQLFLEFLLTLLNQWLVLLQHLGFCLGFDNLQLEQNMTFYSSSLLSQL